MRLSVGSVMVCAGLAICVGAGAGAGAGLSPTNAPSLLVPGHWKLLKLDGKRPARFDFDGKNALEVTSNASVGFFYRELDSSGDNKQVVRWRWRVDRQVPPTDQASKGEDDRAIAVHLWFDDDTSGSLFSVFNRLLGRPKIGHLITYVWGGVRAPGAMMANPYYDKGAIVVLRTSRQDRTGQWVAEERHVGADYARAFGHRPDLSKLRYIAISADTDDTGSTSVARVADVVLAGGG